MNIVNVKRRTISELLKPIVFMIILTIIVFFINSVIHDNSLSFTNIVGILLLIMLMPVYQIFITRRIHIFEIDFYNRKFVILYQNLLKAKKVEIFVDDIEVEIKNTTIKEGCRKLEIMLPNQVLKQYCNKFWSNERMTEVKNQIDELKKQHNV